MQEQTVTSLDRRRFLRLAATAGATLLAGGAIAGCSAESTEPRGGTPNAASDQSGDSTAATSPEANAPASPKTLVAVFSWSGHTLQVAERIHELVESDLFRIEPAEPYTSDYNAVLDVAQREQDDDYRPALAASVENWDDYGTVYLGFPVWWYHVPQIIKTFVTEHDLAGKNVVVFGTSGGSSIAGTVPDIEALCPNVTISGNITLDGDTVSSQLDRVDAWLGDLGLR
ncbi:flavodoxin [Gordonibacter sp. 28C]|uniref:flavodoxin n=1 Tax=Gordonibacter sp. 28C TaxID=2078569 RepID=UPI001313FF2E|nr:flavodoxin [Gordonibacter sp. 28C]